MAEESPRSALMIGHNTFEPELENVVCAKRGWENLLRTSVKSHSMASSG